MRRGPGTFAGWTSAAAPGDTRGPFQPMRLHFALAALLVAVPASAGKRAKGTITLNGEPTAVSWSDGDSFKVKSGPYQGRGTRLVGFNALESFGPVHSWGTWTPQELYALAASAAGVLGEGEWRCTTSGDEDGYHRLLVTCPDAALALIHRGLAMAYAVDGQQADPAALEAQRQAQAERVGMWAKGVPNGVVTSVHSVDEPGAEGGQAYDRVVDTRTGAALKRAHTQTYATCQTVCHETDGDRSCMVYVPFERRYKHKPPCLTDGAPAPRHRKR